MWTTHRWTLFVLACTVCLAAGRINAVNAGGSLRRTLVHGKVTGIESVELIDGAQIEIKGAPGGAVIGSSNKRGRYRIRLPQGVEGALPVVIRADGRWPRRSWVQIKAGARRVRADWDLIPQGGTDFDMDLFDAIARFGGAAGTTRWETPPKFRVLNTAIECVDSLVSTSCTEWVASSSSAFSATTQARLSAIANAPALTGAGGLIGEPEVEIVTLEPGTRFTTGDLLEPGVLTLGDVVPGQFGAAFPVVRPGEVIRTQVMLGSLDVGSGTPWTIARRLATGLGYRSGNEPTELCAQILTLGLRSMFCSMHGTIQATEFDAVMGAVLYGRRVGTSSPDSEPPPAEAEGSRRRR